MSALRYISNITEPMLLWMKLQFRMIVVCMLERLETEVGKRVRGMRSTRSITITEFDLHKERREEILRHVCII